MVFRWAPGMRDHLGRRVLEARGFSGGWHLDAWDPGAGRVVSLAEGSDGKWVESWYDAGAERSRTRATEEPVPDHGDPATRGCLLDQVREDASSRTAFALPPGALGSTWKVLRDANTSPLDFLHPLAEGPTEGEAIWNAVQSNPGTMRRATDRG